MKFLQDSRKGRSLAGLSVGAATALIYFVMFREDFALWTSAEMWARFPVTLAAEITPGWGAWFDGCEHVYLDVGTNMGIQIRKLFEPELYPHDPVLPIYDQLFGTDRAENTRICAVGFEPNPRHTQKLQELEGAYLKKGWRVKIFTATAADVEDGTADFYFDNDAAPEHHEWGASMIPWQNNMKRNEEQNNPNAKTTVETIDLARYVLENVARRRVSLANKRPQGETLEPFSPPIVLMKMDIEGSEHQLLPHLIITGALCKIDTIFYEDHPIGGVVVRGNNNEELGDGTFTAFFEAFARDYDPSTCPTKFANVDNESYGSTDFPLPAFLRRVLSRRQ
jgi:hypothetical protein